MTTAPKKNQKDAAQKSGRGRGAPLGNKNGAGNKGRKRPAGAGSPPLKRGEQSTQIFVRLAQSDANKLQLAADNAGKNKSEYVRDLILQNLQIFS